MKRPSHTLAIFAVIGLLTACSEEIDHLSRAKELLNSDDRTSAIIELKTALQADSANSEARWLLGKSYFDLGSVKEAEKELRLAIDAGASQDIVNPTLAQVLLALKEYDRLERVRYEGLEPEGRSTVQSAIALAMAEQKAFSAARDLSNDALRNSQVSAFAWVAAARISRSDEALASARRQLDNAFAVNPDYAPAWSVLADIENSEGALKEAESAYSKAIDLSSDQNSFSDRLKRTMVRFRLGNTEDTQKDVNLLAKMSPNHPTINFIQGLLHLKDNNREAAKISFQTATGLTNAYAWPLYYLAAIHRVEGELALAENYITRFRAELPEEPEGVKLAATIALQQGRLEEAEDLLRMVIGFVPDDVTTLNLLANALLAQNKKDEGIELLAEIAKLQPESADAQARLGAGLLAVGQDDLGLEALRSTFELDPEYEQTDIVLVLNFLAKENYSAAVDAAEALRERNPDSPTPDNLLGRIYAAQGKISEATDAFTRAATMAPGDPTANHSLAELSLTQGNYKAAREFYQEVLSRNSNNLPTLIKLAASYALENNTPRMAETLERAMAAHPGALEPVLTLARFRMTQGQPAEAQALISGLAEAQMRNPDALAVLAASQLALNTYSEALATAKRLVALRPQAGPYHYMMAQAYDGLNDTEKTKDALRKTIELAPDFFTGRAALARLALLDGEYASFETQLNELRALEPDNPDVLLLEIAYARRQSDPELTTALSEQLFDQFPNSYSAISLAVLRREAGELEAGIDILELWLRAHDKDVRAKEALASLYVAAGRTGEAVKLYDEVLASDPDNVPALNNQAWLLRDLDRRNALRLARQAKTLAPRSVMVLDTLAVILMQDGQLPEALREIDSALILSPSKPNLLFHKAQIAHAQGDDKIAIETLNTLLGSDASFSDRPAAVALLEQLQ